MKNTPRRAALYLRSSKDRNDVSIDAQRRELQKLAVGNGFHTLADDGIRRVLEGVTSMDEVSRVLDLTEGIS